MQRQSGLSKRSNFIYFCCLLFVVCWDNDILLTGPHYIAKLLLNSLCSKDWPRTFDSSASPSITGITGAHHHAHLETCIL